MGAPWLDAAISVTVLDILASICRNVWPEEATRGELHGLMQPQVSVTVPDILVSVCLAK
jgi:hypothetical protein